MDDRAEHEILVRLDHIERYLAQLGAQSGIQYTPYAADPEAFWGPEWADGTASGANGVDADIVAMARSGRMIEAIKMYRSGPAPISSKPRRRSSWPLGVL